MTTNDRQGEPTTKTASGTVYLASILEGVGLLHKMTDRLVGEGIIELLQELDRSVWDLLDLITEERDAA